MPDLGFLADLHFLRPLWLWGLLPAVVVYLLVRRRDDPTLRWRGLIDPHLLEALRGHEVISLSASPAAAGAQGTTTGDSE